MAFDFKLLGEVVTDRLKLRPVQAGDVADIFAFTSNPVGKEYLSWEAHPNIEKTKGFVEYLLQKADKAEPVQWVIELLEEKKVIGITGFVDYQSVHNRGEIAYLLSPDYGGKGYMTEANAAVVKYGFERIGLMRIQAKAEVDNIASQKVLEKIGMSEEGVLRKYIFQKGRYRDYKMYAILSSK